MHDEHLDKNKAQTSMHMEGARKNIVDYVLHTRRPMAIDSFTKSDFYDPLQGMEIGSVLCVPIGLKVSIELGGSAHLLAIPFCLLLLLFFLFFF